MSCVSVTQRIQCAYCLGEFEPQRSTAKCCCGDCRQARHRALRATYVEPASSDARRERFSKARRDATGWGLMTRRETYEADLRVRREAGVE